MEVDLVFEASTGILIKLRYDTKATDSYLTNSSGNFSWTKKSEAEKSIE